MPKVQGPKYRAEDINSSHFYNAKKELKKINLRVTKSAVQEHCNKFELFQRTELKNLFQTDEDQVGG